MEYFVWYGIYLILKELKILPEHVPRGTIPCGGDEPPIETSWKDFIPDMSRSKSIHFCPCDRNLVTGVSECKRTMDVWTSQECTETENMILVTVVIHCKHCGKNTVFSKRYQMHPNLNILSIAIDDARNKLKLQSKGKN